MASDQLPLEQQMPESKWLFAQFVLFLCALTLLYFPSIALLFNRWIQWDQDLSHGLPTLGVFLFLIWRSPPWPSSTDSPKVRLALLVLLSLSSVAWFLFYKINIFLLAYISLLAIVVLFIASCYSKKTAFHLLIPCGILIFVIPLWGHLNGPLVELSAYMVGALARLSGLTLLMDGNNIFIPYGRLYIDDGCSGLRYFVIALLMAYLICHMSHYRLKQSIIAFAVAIALALLINWIRIFLLVIIGYQTEMKSSLMEDHELFGWVLFALVMLPTIYLAPAYKSPAKKADSKVVAKPLLPAMALLLGPVLAMFVGTSLSSAPNFTLNALSSLETSKLSQSFVPIALPGTPLIHSKLVTMNDFVIKVELAQYTQMNTSEKLVPYFRSLFDRDSFLVAHEVESGEVPTHFSILKRVGSERYQVLARVYHVGRFATGEYESAKLLQIPAMLLSENYFTILTAQTSCTDSSCVREIDAIEEVMHLWMKAKDKQ